MRSIPDRLFGFVTPRSDVARETELCVYLDGVDVSQGCQCADDGLGFVVVYVKRPGKSGLREIRFGDVQMFACEKE